MGSSLTAGGVSHPDVEGSLLLAVNSLMNEYFSVTIFGPRQCGKTTLAKNLFPNFSYANLEDMNVRALAKNDSDCSSS